jgi:hypothetical protein
MTLVIGEYAMPDPDQVGYDEYRAIYQVLANKVPNARREDALDRALEVLDEFRTWADHVQKKLEIVHQGS